MASTRPKQVAGRTFSGVLLANLSASVIDNVTSGEGPLVSGFTLPLVRLELATLLAKNLRSLVNFTVSARRHQPGATWQFRSRLAAWRHAGF
jgi:hypothetical protein